MRQLSLALGLCTLTVVTGAAQRAATRSGNATPPVIFVEAGRIERLEQWIKAVARHTPGEEDDALAEIARWPNGDLKALWQDANALAQTMSDVARTSATFTVKSPEQRTTLQLRYTGPQFHRLQVLACASGGSLFEPACLAIKAGDELSAGEMRALFVALGDTRLPAHDVHGRSTIVQLSWLELERRFGRQ